MDKGFTEKELSFLRKLNSPMNVQEFVDTLKYNKNDRISVINVFRLRKADCLEASCLAAYIFSLNKVSTFLMDLKCWEDDDDDHVVCVFKKGGLYGAVAQSKYLGLRYRNPVYKNLRELAMSYFENYFNFKGEFDLESRSIPLRMKSEWIYTKKSMKLIENKLRKIKHIRLVPRGLKLDLVSKTKFKREMLVHVEKSKISRRYW